MRAVVIESPHQLNVTTVHDPAPGPRDVVVKVAAVGLCGTDVHMLEGEFGPAVYPVVPGHEFAGEVVETGSAVTGHALGERVAVNPGVFCGDCHFCAVGRGNLCERWRTIGITENGACAEYVKVPAANVHRLPDGLETGHAPLIEPLSTVVHGIDLVAPAVGDHFLIYGAGTMGLLYLQMARRHGAASVCVIDLKEDRLAVARRLGADQVATHADELARAGTGWEVVIDCTGDVPAIEDAFTRVRRGGTFQQFGAAPDQAMASFSPFRICADEIRVVGCMATLHSYGRALDLLAKGWIDSDTVITHRFALDAYEEALDTFRQGTGLKVQLVPDLVE